MVNLRLQTTRYTSWFLVPLTNFIQILPRFVPVNLIIKYVLGVLLGFVGNTWVLQGSIVVNHVIVV